MRARIMLMYNMQIILVLAVLLGLIGLILYLRVPSHAVVLSVLIGYILSSQVSSDIYGFVAKVSGLGDYQNTQIGLLVLPLLLSILFLRGRARGKIAINVGLVTVAMILLAMFLYKLVPIIKTNLDIASYGQIDGYKNFIIIACGLLALFFTWLSLPKHIHDEHGKK